MEIAEIARKKIDWAEGYGCLGNLMAQAREVIAANGASSLMPLEVAKMILLLVAGQFDAWASIQVEKTHQRFIEEARRDREDLETAARATEVGKRYSAMSPEEFAGLRRMADEGMKNRLGTGEADRLVNLWAARLSRALDVIERVTGERDGCTKKLIERSIDRVDDSAHPANLRLVDGYCCPKCGSVFMGEGAAKDGIVTCPNPSCRNSWQDERRCGTCARGLEVPGKPGLVCCTVCHIGVGYGFFGRHGPPWSDCRDWKPKR